jgi:Helicase conserved C-terminal domain
MNTIRSWLITKGYTIKQAKIAVRSYHATLSESDKSREYRNFYTEDLPTRILITSDALAHGADIPDIIRSIVYGYHPDKSLNMILQRFGRAARRDGVTGYAIILIEDWYKGALADIAPPKRKSRKPTAPLSTRLGRDFIAARMAIQEDGAADFASDLASFVTINSDIISQVSAREEEDRILNENITSLALPIEHMEKQKRAKTDAEKRAVLPDILYELANEATGCLRNILLKPYKETSPLSGGPRCCSNCDNSLQAYKEYDIVAPYTRNIAKSKYSKDLFASVKKWIKGWLDTTYQDAVWSPISSHIISDDQIRMLCIQPPLTREGLKRILPEWDHSLLGDEVDALIRFIREEETRYSSTSVSQVALQSSRRVVVSRSSSQTPLLLVGQWGPVGASTIRSAGLNQPLQTEVLPPLQLSLASSSQTDITESQISQLALTQDLQANCSQTTHATLSQSSQQLDIQYPHTLDTRLPARKSSGAYPQNPQLGLRHPNNSPQRLHCSQQLLNIAPHHPHDSPLPQFVSQNNLGVGPRCSLQAPQQKSDSIVGSNIGGASPRRGVRSPQQSPRAVIANQRGLVDDPAGNSLSSAAICGNLVSTATANCRIMAPSTATQQQDTRRELAHAAGVDGYLQGRRSGSAAHLSTRARRSRRLSKSSSDRPYISAQQRHASPGGSPVRLGSSSRRADSRANVLATIESAPFQPAESTGGKSGTSRRSARVRSTTSAHIASANTTLSRSLQPILPSTTALASSMTLKKTQRRPFADISGNASVNEPQPKRRISELTAQH